MNFRRDWVCPYYLSIRTTGGCSRLRETKIKHLINRLFRQNHNIIIFEDENWNEKGICLKMLQNLGIGGGGLFLVGTWFLEKLSWYRKYISSYPKAWIHIYFQIFCLFFTTMLYKLLKREYHWLSPRKYFINILRLYSSTESCSCIYASTQAFTCFI